MPEGLRGAAQVLRIRYWAPHCWDRCGVRSPGGPYRRRRVAKLLPLGRVRSGGDVLPAALASAAVALAAAAVAQPAAALTVAATAVALAAAALAVRG